MENENTFLKQPPGDYTKISISSQDFGAAASVRLNYCWVD